MTGWPLFLSLGCALIIGFVLGCLITWWIHSDAIERAFDADWNDWDGHHREHGQ